MTAVTAPDRISARATRITFASVTTSVARAWRAWRDCGALLPAAAAGPWGDYADPDRDHARVLSDVRAAR